MTELLLDSSILIDLFEQRLDVKTKEFLSTTPASISALSIFEVKKFLYSIGRLQEWEKIMVELNNYPIIPVGYSICDVAAAYAHQHRLSLADSIIYSTAKTSGKTLVTSDSDFKGLKDVLVVKKK